MVSCRSPAKTKTRALNGTWKCRASPTENALDRADAASKTFQMPKQNVWVLRSRKRPSKMFACECAQCMPIGASRESNYVCSCACCLLVCWRWIVEPEWNCFDHLFAPAQPCSSVALVSSPRMTAARGGRPLIARITERITGGAARRRQTPSVRPMCSCSRDRAERGRRREKYARNLSPLGSAHSAVALRAVG